MREVVVARARLHEIALPLAEPFTISGGTMTTRRSLIVELEGSDGTIGYGESAPFEFPFYSSETIASARSCIEMHLLPRIIGVPLSDSASLHRLLSDGIRGNRMARAGVDTAWWDLQAAVQEVSLAELVTSRLKELKLPSKWVRRGSTIECGVALGIPEGLDGAQLRDWVAAAVQSGYRRIKIKIRPGWDVEPIHIVKETLRDLGSDLPISADANGAYDRLRHRQDLQTLDEEGLLFIEQPLPAEDLWDLTQLSRELETAVCVDETLVSESIARQLIEMGGPRIWNIKIQRVGGLEEACRIYARAATGGAKLWGGTMPETGLGAQAMLALGCHGGFVYPSDLEPSERWYGGEPDLVTLVMRDDGTMAVPSSRPELRLGERAKLVAEIA